MILKFIKYQTMTPMSSFSDWSAEDVYLLNADRENTDDTAIGEQYLIGTAKLS